MKNFTVRLYQITAAAIFVQLLLGGLLTFSFIDPTAHTIMSFIVFALAIATMIAALISKPSIRPLKAMSIVMVLLLIVQILLGFDILRTSDQLIAWVHFVTALLIYGLAVSGTFMAVQLNRASRMQVRSPAGVPS